MGRPVTWQYAVVWTPNTPVSTIEFYRISSSGHRFLWATADMPEWGNTPALPDILQQLYVGVLELMERTGVVDA
jgi:hypothetical protein